jgi:uncharacterized protein
MKSFANRIYFNKMNPLKSKNKGFILRSAFIFSLSLFWISFSTQAVVLQDLYQYKVPVSSHAAIQYVSIQKQALRHVIQKVTGLDDIYTIQDVNAILDQASKLVLKTEIETNNEPLRYGADPFLGVLTFNENELNQLLSSALAPIWSKNRPQILAWIAVEDKGQKTVIGEEQPGDGTIISAIIAETEKRGLPVNLPKYDFDDANILYPVDIWGFFLDTIETASERYSHDMVLSGRIEKQSDLLYQSKWALKQGNDVSFFNFDNAASQEDAVSQIMLALATKLGKKFAILGDLETQNRIRIDVGPILQIRDYADMLTYIEQLKVVKNVKVLGIKNNKIQLGLELAGTLNTFNHYVSLNNRLAPIQNKTQTSDDSSVSRQELLNQVKVYEYRWQTGF